MNILDALAKMGLEIGDLRKVLEFVAGSGTDLAPKATELLAKMEGGVPAEKLAELATVLPKEILNATLGKFDGRFHPGGAA